MRGALCVLMAVGVVCATAPQGRPALDLSGSDSRVRPQDDLYRFANGVWLESAIVPPDRTTTGTFTDLADKAESDLHDLIDGIVARSRRRAGSPEQQIADFYLSATDDARLDALGVAPVRAELDRIDAIRAPADLAAEAGALTTALGGGPFALTVVVDTKTGGLIAQVAQGGTLLPTRDHYLRSDAAFAGIRAQYEAYLAKVFALAGRVNAEADARDVLAFETRLAAAQLPPAESQRAARLAASLTLQEIAVTMPGFDWMAWAKPQGIHRASRVALLQPEFFKAFAEIVGSTPLPTLRAWLAARHITSMAPYLSRAMADARFALFGSTLTGQIQPRARWKVGVSLVSGFLGDAVGRLYVEQHFPPRAKARATRIVQGLIRAYRDAISQASWLSSATRAESIAKLDRVTAHIGYPDMWRSYDGLRILPDDLTGNVERARRFDSDYRMSQVAGPSRLGEWLVTAQTVNAFYNPGLNAIYLPAAMLQAPHFDPDADDAVNFGALGATVGHELSHAFDERGRGYDASGDVRVWWAPGDTRQFRARAQPLVAQFAAYRPLAGVADAAVNGELTFQENLADLLGLSVAYRAYTASLGGNRAPILDGFSGDQRFFLSYARMWRVKVRDDYLRQWLLALPYAPYEYRANGIASHLEGFQAAFGVTPGDALYRASDVRVKIW